MEIRNCRCCLSPGMHKDLDSTYLWLNNMENYSEMLLECFSISLHLSDHTSSAICEECIKLIRRSCNFKRQVLHNEQELLKTLPNVQENDEMKTELKPESPLEDDSEYLYYYPSDVEQQSPDVKSEQPLEDEDDYILPDAEGPVQDKPTISSNRRVVTNKVRLDIGNLRKLVAAVVNYSTMMPFRWLSNKYVCFYCLDYFSSSQDLRQHTKTHPPEPEFIQQNVRTNTKIKVDITEIMCTKCSKHLDTINQFFDHLNEEHGMKLIKEQSVHISTFKLSDDGMFCLDCGQKFLFFATLLAHTHQSHRKGGEFLCQICSQAYPNRADVMRHMKAVHHIENVTMSCKKCDKSYLSEYALRDHMRRTHNEGRLKCPKCPEVLQSPYFKKRHMATVHGEKELQFNCDMCPKTFFFMSKLTRHKLMTHLKEKNLTCEKCGFKVFNKDLLKKHMVSHDDATPFQCDYCEKSFRWKKSLDFHIRTHTNDRRYVCNECGKAFIQIGNLKLHKKTHHRLK